MTDSYVALDLETTGIGAKKEKITEIGMVKVLDGQIVSTYHSMVNPRRPIPEKIVRLTEDSGLVQRYLSQGLPVINLLNIKQLAADYGLPYDPAQWPERGTSAVYFETEYPGAVLLLGLAGAAVLLALCRWVRRSAGTARKEERGYHGQTESSADHPDH